MYTILQCTFLPLIKIFIYCLCTDIYCLHLEVIVLIYCTVVYSLSLQVRYVLRIVDQ